MNTEGGDVHAKHSVIARRLPRGEVIEHLRGAEERRHDAGGHASRLEVAFPFVARRHGRGHVGDHGIQLRGRGHDHVHVVAHEGNQASAPEEVDVVDRVVRSLLARDVQWVGREGGPRRLVANDVLVLAPYNAQVAALRRKHLDSGVHRVGTVDKFQGQEAAVVIYSMASSSPEDAPRGMEFLYSRNRLNVATRRARGVAIVVASPRLFAAEVPDAGVRCEWRTGSAGSGSWRGWWKEGRCEPAPRSVNALRRAGDRPSDPVFSPRADSTCAMARHAPRVRSVG